MTRLLLFCGFVLISIEAFSSGGEHAAAGGSFVLAGSFGQTLVYPNEITTLKNGFYPGVFVFLKPNVGPAFLFSAAAIIQSGEKISPVITDDNGIQSSKLFYRPIAKATFDSVALTPSSANVFESTVQAGWLDAMGLEYYFKATDMTGKKSRSPVSGYYRSYGVTTGAFLPNTVYNIGTEQIKYRVISIPYDFANKGVGTQFTSLGAHEKSVYRLATYGNNSWLEYSDGFTEITQGKGYWFLTKNSDAVVFSEPKTPQKHRGNLFEMELQPGWNQVGNPYTVAISWEDVRDFNSGIAMNALKVFDGAFKDGDELAPFTGGFVFLQGSAAQSIKIPFKTQTIEGGRKRKNDFSTDLENERWMLKLSLDDGIAVSSMAAIGMHPEASLLADLYDDFYPPRFIEYAELQFKHPEHNIRYFAKDVVATQEKHTWSLVVESLAPLLTLKWDNQHMGDNDIDLVLYDITNSRIINMRDANSCVVSAGAHYQIAYGKNIRDEMRPERTVAGKPFPNPLLRGSEAHVTIPFGLPESKNLYRVNVEIVDVQGRSVKNVFNNDLKPGFYEFTWDGIDQQDQQCPGGIYLYRVSVTQGGSQTTFSERILIQE
jgi:hypothetical protein